MDKNEAVRFPSRFLWGASMSAHQVEGGNHNQWSVWELENAKALAHAAEYQLGDLDVWDKVKDQAKRPDNYVSGKTVEHYERYESDIALAKKLNMNALRFSVEWSRVEPREGAWNVEAIEHYKNYVLALKKAGIEPVLTLFHFTLPLWFSDMGGFEKRANNKYFVRFAEKVLTELGASVKFVITINEPETYAAQSYYVGNWPPAVSSKPKFVKVYHNLARVHNQTAKMIHGLNRRYKVSVAANCSYVYAGDDAKLSMTAAAIAQYFSDDYFIRMVHKQCDFLGINYYFSNRIYGYRTHNPDQRVSDMGWDMAPENLEFLLERMYTKWHLPIIITENGVADMSDEKRQWWLAKTIQAMQAAIKEGVELKGYLHWSLLDNFEWAYGKWPRFGLIEVDYESMERRPRPSAKRYAAFIKKVRRSNE